MSYLKQGIFPPKTKKVFLAMKLTMLFLLFFIVNVHASGFGQERIDLKAKKTVLAEVLHSIEQKTTYRFLYNNNLEQLQSKVSINARSATIDEVLPVLLFYTNLTFQKMDNNLIVLKEDPLGKKDITVTGKVTDSSGAPLSGVSVQVKGTTIGTTTNAEGAFTLSIPDPNSTLVFSIVGYDEQEYPLNGSTSVTVSMKAAQQVMDQVVVIGYGTARKRDLTGSVASVKGEDLAKQPVASPTQALQGKVAGVQIIASGQPNAAPAVRIRGTGSMLSGVNPLYVVDGIITDDIRNINSADIVSMDILKDASATAIYGMRAANGVLIITTKKGRAGKMVINYDASLGVKEASHLVNMAGPHQYATYKNEANIYYGSGDSLVTASNLSGGYNTDWFDAILRKGFWQNHNVSLSGGSDKVTYFFSAGYVGEDGTIVTNKFSRFTLRSNNEYRINKAIKISSLISYSRSDLHDVDLGVLNSAYRAAPYVPAKVGDLYGNTSLSNNVGNPLLSLDKRYNQTIDNRLQGNFAADIKIASWLTFRSSFGADLDFPNTLAYIYQYDNTGANSVFIPQGGNQVSQKSSLNISRTNTGRWVWDNTFTATKSFGLHNFTLLAGTTAEEYTTNTLTGSRTNVPAAKNEWFLGVGDPSSANNGNTGGKFTRNSYIGRLTYNFDERYLLTATFRADGTSKFASYNHWGYFPSVSGGWNLAREAFMSSQKLFSTLKLRAGYGKVGNDQISSNTYLTIAGTGLPYYFGQPGVLVNGINFPQLPDPNVHWETTEEIGAGLDFAMLNDRLSGTLDYYDKKVNDALINITIGATLPDQDGLYTTNAATISNKGFEASLDWKDRVGENWSYNFGGNIAFNKNTIIGLNGGQPLRDGGNSQGFTTLTDNGHPIGSFYLLQMDGIFQNADEIAASAQKTAVPGDIRYKDINGDGKIDDNDRVFSGSYQPKVTYGVNGGVTYKEFDLSFGGYGTVGSKIYNGKKQSVGTDPRDNIETKVANGRWTPNNPNNSIPRANIGLLPNSTYFLENGNFFRMNNITIGYNITRRLLERFKISRLRIYATAQNVFTLTKYSGFSPEISSSTPLNAGIELNSYPSIRTWAAGINLSF